MGEWQEFVGKIRSWDRKEHNWAMSNKGMDFKNLKTKNDFIHSLMKEYKLTKRKKKWKNNPQNPIIRDRIMLVGKTFTVQYLSYYLLPF